jgi:hypothetical protein
MKTRTILQGICLSAAGAAALLARAVDGQESRLDATRAAMQDRIEAERLISREKLDWAVGRELLQSRIDLTERQIGSLREDIAESRTGVTDLGGQKAELVEQNERLKEASQALAERIAELEGRTRALLPRLPESLQERVQPLSQRIPDDPVATKASLSERAMNVVGILNQVTKFQREVSVTSEVRVLPGGATAEVAALYVGLGQAYYVTNDGTSAGVGRPSPDGFVWEPASESAAAIARAIAIYASEEPAAYVRLPLRVE